MENLELGNNLVFMSENELREVEGGWELCPICLIADAGSFLSGLGRGFVDGVETGWRAVQLK